MKKRILLPALALTLSLISPALAQASDSETCFDAGFYKKLLAKTSGVEAQYREVVNADIAMGITMENDAPFPERFTFREGDVDTDLPILSDGSIPAANDIAGKGDGEFCIIDPRIADEANNTVGASVDVDADVLFLNTSGTHSLSELTIGLKDGKRFYKKLYGAMASLIKISHVMIDYEEDGVAPQISALKDGEIFGGLQTEEFYGAYLVSIKALKKMGADGLSIRGGAYTLSPVPNKKTLEKYFGQ